MTFVYLGIIVWHFRTWTKSFTDNLVLRLERNYCLTFLPITLLSTLSENPSPLSKAAPCAPGVITDTLWTSAYLNAGSTAFLQTGPRIASGLSNELPSAGVKIFHIPFSSLKLRDGIPIQTGWNYNPTENNFKLQPFAEHSELAYLKLIFGPVIFGFKTGSCKCSVIQFSAGSIRFLDY